MTTTSNILNLNYKIKERQDLEHTLEGLLAIYRVLQDNKQKEKYADLIRKRARDYYCLTGQHYINVYCLGEDKT